MATELEELRQRQDALEEVVRQLEHRVTMDDSMLRSIGLHQGFHANHLKDMERELKNLQAKQEHHHEIAMMRTEGPLEAIK